MTERGDGWSETRTTVVRDDRPSDRDSDVAVARRGVASFGGGGGPGVGESVRDFVRRYGWRAYALPILVIVTVVALLTVHNSTPSKPVAAAAKPAAPSPAHVSSPPVASGNISLKSDAGGDNAEQEALKGGALPKGPGYTKTGDGTYRVLKGTSKPIGSGQLFRYDVEVENGVKGVDLKQFAAMVQSTLANSKSWSGHGVKLERVDSGFINFHVSLTSAMTVRQYCGYDIPVETSCYATAGTGGLSVNRVVFNVARWVRGAAPYVGDLNSYRIYMINHEDGHALGHQHAHQCLPGGLAPVMMQQTFGLKSATTGKQCGANPWPYPVTSSGAPVAGVPGAEQPDTKQNNEYYLGD